MIKPVFPTLLALFLALPALTAQQAGPPAIDIQVGGLPAGQAYLIGVFADQQFRVDSAQVDADGRMRFQRDDPYPAGLYYIWLPDKMALQVLLDDDQTFSLKTRKGELVEAMEAEGSLDNELLYRNLDYETRYSAAVQEASARLQALAPESPEYRDVKKQVDELVTNRKAHLEEIFTRYPDAFFTRYKKAGQNPDPREVYKPDGTLDSALQVYFYRTDFWKDVDFSDPRLLRTPVIANKLQRYIKTLTVQHPDSINAAARFLVDQVLAYPEYFKFFANWITLQYQPTKSTLMDSEAVFVFMVERYFTQERAFWSDSLQTWAIQKRASEMAASLVGKQAPDVRAPGPDGQYHSIYEITAPYIIVFMYNPTCDHCIEETPKLVRFYREWKDKGVEVFAIALDTEDAEWKDFIARNGMDWVNVFDPTNRSIYGKYWVDITPELYVLNPDRKIIGKNLKVNQVEEVIRRDQRGG
ncbi:MAG: redoxin domain-containing protein [Lewinellaceae bacterium]|nr:redoxin domain-containing protein [Lewinellaceae bacterium]